MSSEEADRKAKEEEDNKKKEEEKKKNAPPPETPAQKLVRISRLYFWVGFFFLPWLWLANVVMLLQYRNRPHVPPEIILYRNSSAICFCIASTIFALYVILARTALIDLVPWIIKPGISAWRQGGLFNSAALQTESPS